MAKLKQELKDILDKYDIDYRDKTKLWDCHGTLVLYHKAYEIIAAKEGIKFDLPHIIESSAEKKIACISVMGHMKDRSEWSFGEAAPANNKNAYPLAMAEKRAKDRVIAKLVGLAAYVYSEEEADDFKDEGKKKSIESGFGADDVPPNEWIQERMKNLETFVYESKAPSWKNFDARVAKINNDPIFSKIGKENTEVWARTFMGLVDSLTDRIGVSEDV